jgi:hypothetical protein
MHHFHMPRAEAWDELPLAQLAAYRAAAIEGNPWSAPERASPGYVEQEWRQAIGPRS